MHDVESHVARTCLAKDCVEVGAIVVEKTSGLVHEGRNPKDVLLEKAKCAWICEHYACNIGSKL